MGWSPQSFQSRAAALAVALAVSISSYAAAGTPADASGPYDVVIRGGRILDPDTHRDVTGLAIGIRARTVAAITSDPIRGRQEIDAAGRVVAPGFIDILSYNPNAYGVWYKLADGVTTNLAMHGAEGTGGDMAAWYRAYERQRPPVNFGGGFHYEAARARIGVGRYGTASPGQMDRLMDLAARALDDGALGIAMSPEYAPGTSTVEIEAMMRVAARYGVPVFLHVRYSDMEPPGTNLEALDEVIGAARRTGAPIHIDHINSTGGTHSMRASLRLLQEARAAGVDVTACIYPYPYWATYLSSARFDAGWQKRFGITYSDLQIPGTTARLTPETFRQHRRLGTLAVAYAIPEADVIEALRSPFVMLGSDAILEPANRNHPRAAGTFSRTLGLYVRERRVLSLMDALAKMTIMPARRLEARAPALARKGRLQEGADADIVIFDPARVRSRATVERPNQFAEGIDYVLVGGRVVRDPGGFRTEVRAGEAIRAVFRRVRPSGVFEAPSNSR